MQQRSRPFGPLYQCCPSCLSTENPLNNWPRSGGWCPLLSTVDYNRVRGGLSLTRGCKGRNVVSGSGEVGVDEQVGSGSRSVPGLPCREPGTGAGTHATFMLLPLSAPATRSSHYVVAAHWATGGSGEGIATGASVRYNWNPLNGGPLLRGFTVY